MKKLIILLTLFLSIQTYSQKGVIFVRNYKHALYIGNIKEKDSLFFQKLKENNLWEVENYTKHSNYNYAETVIVTNYNDILAICEKYNLNKADAIPILNYLLVTRFRNQKNK